MRGSVVHDLVRRAGNISVHVIAGEELPSESRQQAGRADGSAADPFNPRPYLMALLIVAIGLGAAVVGSSAASACENVDLVFLTAVVVVAARYGLLPSLLASVAASLCYNFFFLPPVYTFTITDPTNVAAFFFFMLIALLVSNVAARVRTQAGYRDRPRAHHRIALTPSAASSRAPRRWTTCCGRPPIRSP